MLTAPKSITIIDQIGNTIIMPAPAQRIVCLVPSLTETLCEMGLQNMVVGVTKFCIYPKNINKKVTQIGGTKNINVDKIKALKPHIIIASKEENIKEQIEALQPYAQVYVTDIKTIDDTVSALNDIAVITDTNLVNFAWYKKLLAYNNMPLEVPKFNVIYLIWRRPYMGVGGNTFIHFMLEKAGYINCLKYTNRYPIITKLFLLSTPIDFIFLSSEPFPFTQKHINELQILLPYTKIILVDGEIFSWYGHRTTKALTYFANLQKIIASYD